MGTAYLELGVGGVAETARKKIDPINKNAEQNLLLGCVADVYEAFSAYIGRYAAHAAEALAAAAEDAAERARLSAVAAKLRGIVREPPHSFAEAVQLFYLTWRARCINATSCIGRLDMHLWPFYQKDIEKGIVTRESALEQLLALWKLLNLCGSGDTLINVMVGGRDAEGSDMTNDLSVLMLEASLRCAKTEPHISVRVHKNSRPDLVDAMCRLQLEGFGQATMYCDDTLIPALIRSGLSPALAAAYANDGCTEVILDGASTIDFAQVEAVKCVELTLGNGDEPPLPGDPVAHYWTRHGAKTEWHTACGLGYRSGDPEGFETYDDLYTAFLAQYRYQTVRTLERQFEWLCLHRRVGTSSPLLNGTFMSMLDSARDIQRGGLPHNVVMLFSGSIRRRRTLWRR